MHTSELSTTVVKQPDPAKTPLPVGNKRKFNPSRVRGSPNPTVNISVLEDDDQNDITAKEDTDRFEAGFEKLPREKDAERTYIHNFLKDVRSQERAAVEREKREEIEEDRAVVRYFFEEEHARMSQRFIKKLGKSRQAE